jgi:tetratricopeptide (TPR) repeat protein
MEVLLNERLPARRFEVVTVAMTAINSHALQEIAADVARADGDVWVVYAGNNEYLGPFGAGRAFGPAAPSLTGVRLGLALRRLRLGQLLARTLAAAAPADGTPAEWEGLRAVADESIAPDDPARVRVAAHFRANLGALLATAARRDIPAVLTPAAVNLKDFPPFASRSPALNSNPAAREAALADALLAEAAGDAAGLRAALARAAAADPRHADTQYRLGRAELALANGPAALEAFHAAVDADALPLRTDRPLAHAAAQAAETAPGLVALANLPGELARLGRGGAPGHEFFYEHVHLTPDGAYVGALLLAREVERLLPEAARAGARTDWATAETVAERLALTPWNRLAGFELMQARLRAPPFTGQAVSAARLRAVEAQVTALRRAGTPAALTNAFLTFSNALAARPEDYWLHRGHAEFLELARQPPALAAAAWDRAAALAPHHPIAWYQAGRLHARAGDTNAALARVTTALARRPDFVEPRLLQAGLLLRAGRGGEARAHLLAAVRRSPRQPRLFIGLAEVETALGRRAEAAASLERALALREADWEAHHLLGVERAVAERFVEAERHFRRAVELRPAFVPAQFNLAVALARLGRSAEAAAGFREVLRLDPAHAQAQELLARLTGPSAPAPAPPP